MAGLYEVELKVLSASNLKNVNWKNGPLRPYVVVWLDTDASAKATTSVAPLADSGPEGTDPVWDADEDVRAKVILPIPRHTEPHETALLVDVVHAVNHEADDGNGKVKPLVGSGRILLQDILEEVGIGERTMRSLQLNRPSGRPQGMLDIKICVREPPRSYYYDSRPAPPPTAAPYYGSSGYPTNASRDVPYGYGAPPAGYPYGSAPGAPPPTAGYGGYGAPPAGYPAYGGASAAPPAGYPGYGGAATSDPAATKSKSKFGVGTGVAVGAAAGLLGGLALSEGYSHLKENIAQDAAAKVEEDYGYDDDY